MGKEKLVFTICGLRTVVVAVACIHSEIHGFAPHTITRVVDIEALTGVDDRL